MPRVLSGSVRMVCHQTNPFFVAGFRHGPTAQASHRAADRNLPNPPSSHGRCRAGRSAPRARPIPISSQRRSRAPVGEQFRAVLVQGRWPGGSPYIRSVATARQSKARGARSDGRVELQVLISIKSSKASNSLRRDVFFHRQGEIRDRTFENQSFRASGLSLT
jgi:hypothetical protein